MSLRHLRDVLALTRLPPFEKSLLVHLADQCDADGVVRASVPFLMRVTGMSRRTVQRTFDRLEARQLVRPMDVRGGSSARCYVLTQGVSIGHGCLTDTGVREAPEGVSHRRVSDPSYFPTSREVQREARAALPVEKGQPTETPTPAQVTKLVFVLLDSQTLEFTERGELEELLKRACAQAHFRYDTQVIDAAIQRALASRGVDPESRDVSRARQNRR